MATPRRRALLCAFSNTNQLTGAKFRAIRGIENDADRLIWPIPHKEVSAALEPVHCRFRVGSLRAAGLLRQTQAILATRPTTTRVDRGAGPSWIGPGARSFTNESNVGVSANDCSSFKTKPGSSAQGLAEGCFSEFRPYQQTVWNRPQS